MDYLKKSLRSLEFKKDYEEIDTRLASGWYVDRINTPVKPKEHILRFQKRLKNKI